MYNKNLSLLLLWVYFSRYIYIKSYTTTRNSVRWHHTTSQLNKYLNILLVLQYFTPPVVRCFSCRILIDFDFLCFEYESTGRDKWIIKRQETTEIRKILWLWSLILKCEQTKSVCKVIVNHFPTEFWRNLQLYFSSPSLRIEKLKMQSHMLQSYRQSMGGGRWYILWTIKKL